MTNFTLPVLPLACWLHPRPNAAVVVARSAPRLLLLVGHPARGAAAPSSIRLVVVKAMAAGAVRLTRRPSVITRTQQVSIMRRSLIGSGLFSPQRKPRRSGAELQRPWRGHPAVSITQEQRRRSPAPPRH